MAAENDAALESEATEAGGGENAPQAANVEDGVDVGPSPAVGKPTEREEEEDSTAKTSERDCKLPQTPVRAVEAVDKESETQAVNIEDAVEVTPMLVDGEKSAAAEREEAEDTTADLGGGDNNLEQPPIADAVEKKADVESVVRLETDGEVIERESDHLDGQTLTGIDYGKANDAPATSATSDAAEEASPPVTAIETAQDEEMGEAQGVDDPVAEAGESTTPAVDVQSEESSGQSDHPSQMPDGDHKMPAPAIDGSVDGQTLKSMEGVREHPTEGDDGKNEGDNMVKLANNIKEADPTAASVKTKTEEEVNEVRAPSPSTETPTALQVRDDVDMQEATGSNLLSETSATDQEDTTKSAGTVTADADADVTMVDEDEALVALLPSPNRLPIHTDEPVSELVLPATTAPTVPDSSTVVMAEEHIIATVQAESAVSAVAGVEVSTQSVDAHEVVSENDAEADAIATSVDAPQWFADDEQEDDDSVEIELSMQDEALANGASVFDLYEDAEVAGEDKPAPTVVPEDAEDDSDSSGMVMIVSSVSGSSSSGSSSSSSGSSSSGSSSSSSSDDEDGQRRQTTHSKQRAVTKPTPKPKPRPPVIPHVIPPEFRVFENVTLDDRDFPILKGTYSFRSNRRACFEGHWGFCEDDFTQDRVSPFEYLSRRLMKQESDRWPLSGKYTGFFKLRQFNGRLVKVREDQVDLQFMKMGSDDGSDADDDDDESHARYEVIGKGRNRFGRFLIRGYLNMANGRLTVRRRYIE